MTNKEVKSFEDLLKLINEISESSEKNINKIIKYVDLFKKNKVSVVSEADIISFFESSLGKIGENEVLFMLKLYNSLKSLNPKNEFRTESLKFIYKYCYEIITTKQDDMFKNEIQTFISNDYSKMYSIIEILDKKLKQINEKRFDKKVKNGKYHVDSDSLNWFCAATIYLWFVCKYKTKEYIITFEKALAQYYIRIEDEETALLNVIKFFPESLESKSEWKNKLKNAIYLYWNTEKLLQEKDEWNSKIYSNISRLERDKESLNKEIIQLKKEKENLNTELEEIRLELNKALADKEIAIKGKQNAENERDYITNDVKMSYYAKINSLFFDLKKGLKLDIEGIEKIASHLDDVDANLINIRIQHINNLIDSKLSGEK